MQNWLKISNGLVSRRFMRLIFCGPTFNCPIISDICFYCFTIIMIAYHSFATFLGGRHIRHDGRAERDVTLANAGNDTSNHEDSERGRHCPQYVRQRNTHLQQNTYFTRVHRIYCIAVYYISIFLYLCIQYSIFFI